MSSVIFSPDGKYVLTGGGDGTVNTWDSKSGQELGRFTAHSRAILSLGFSPDGRYLLTGSDDNTVKIWDAHSHLGIAQFSGHTGEIYSMQLSADDKYLLTSSQDKTARLWDTATAKEVRQFTGHTDWVLSAAFSPDNKYMVTGSQDKTARVWDLGTGKEVVSFADPNGSGPTGGGPGPVAPVGLSNDDKTVLSGDTKGLAILWDAQSGLELERLGAGSAYPAAVFSPDGKSVLTALSAPWSDTWGAALWDVKTGQSICFFKGHSADVMAVAFSRDGKYVLTGSADKSARLWDAQTGQELRRFKGHAELGSREGYHSIATG